MSPPTNGATSFAFTPMTAASLPDALLFPFDGFSADDFFNAAPPPPPPPPPEADPNRLLLLPSSPYNNVDVHGNGTGSAGFGPEALAIAAPTSTVATSGSSSSAPRSPSPSLPLMPSVGERTSRYRGVTRYYYLRRCLATDKCGGYEKEDRAARAYDIAALKYWGANAIINFPKENYIKEIEEMQNISRLELVASLRRKSSGFSRGASIYRGVTRHHQHGRWQARIGRVAGNKDLYLGTFATEEEAAEAYDIAAIKFRGDNAVTNFQASRYNLEAIARSDLPINGPGRRLNSYNYKPPAAPEAQQVQQITSAPPFPQQLSNGVSPCLLHTLLQLPPSAAPMHALPLSSYGGVGVPGFYWPFGEVEQKVQLDGKMEVVDGILQLANPAV
ncbi:AP2-like ethylene-responsive transcription factor AIL7 [Lolium rigidum]|uniref:AP2-like ethylene-responsive transcription factor AIL7 n=1 Tax=Lolium rigidum TaxID=89674 RepID=UPI001F5D086A|nr:AP2-like ethylene-responsive transcription factor AIL7 [Lolium rigidum]